MPESPERTVASGFCVVSFDSNAYLSEYSYSGSSDSATSRGEWDVTAASAGSATKNLGFRFANAEGLHYGWAEATTYGVSSATLNRISWETNVNQAITVDAVPEPGTLPLLAIGLDLLTQRGHSTKS